jgi:hypothetical protein
MEKEDTIDTPEVPGTRQWVPYPTSQLDDSPRESQDSANSCVHGCNLL